MSRGFLAVSLLAFALEAPVRVHGHRGASGAGPADASSADAVKVDWPGAPAWARVEPGALLTALRPALAGPAPSATVTIDYPFPDTIYPPDLVPPTVLFRDASGSAEAWLVEVAVAGHPGRTFVLTDGRREPPELDPRCGPPGPDVRETEPRGSDRGWTPDAETWAAVATPRERDVVLTVRGLRSGLGSAPVVVSSGTVRLRVSADPVGAPVFYRDVPLVPTSNENGVIMPIAEGSLPLIEWRLRDLSRPRSTVVLKDMPTCANCHSFSDDGRTLGMDMDGPTGDKGSYGLAPVGPRIAFTRDRVFTWSSFRPSGTTFGLFSRVSPDGRHVVSSVDEAVFVANYLDFRFLQTFYPTRGVLAIYDRDTGKIATLPGADDPAFVQCNAVWTPDGRDLVFLRAPAGSPKPAGAPPESANDPREVRVKYDLYTIPFADGKGGEAKPIPGASANGTSNSFPKISPDGRRLVWVRAGNGLLMRPDSRLWIMPLAGGAPREMSCNLPRMNSWHAWSPNGRWLVFASKAFTPYTQLYLTHVDAEGRDSPAVLIPGSTPANRAANLPEFANIPPDGIASIDVPAIDYRRRLIRAAALMKAGDLAGGYGELVAADELRPDFPETLAAMGFYFRQTGDVAKAVQYFERALAIDPRSWAAHNFYGATLFRQGKYEEALAHFQAAVEVNPLNAQSLTSVGVVEYARGDLEKARASLRSAAESNPRYAKAHFNLALVEGRLGHHAEAAARYEDSLRLEPGDAAARANLAWLYATCPDASVRNGARARELAAALVAEAPRPSARLWDILAAACARDGKFADAVGAAEKALALTPGGDPSYELRRRLLDTYKAGRTYSE